MAISDKQKKILAFQYSDYDALICDGAIRSGKTSIMTLAFIDWAMANYSNQRFGICGKTVDSAIKNIITPYITMNYAKRKYAIRWRKAEKVLEVSRGAARNYFEVFGGKDESSYMLIQGRTFAGVMLDEVALMPESFVNQALARCSVSGARLWFSCNPSSPNHWFYKGWIQRHKERNALYLRFAMQDNPSLDDVTLARYNSMYSGVFHDRYILGKWVVAEGLVYPMFDNVVETKDRPYDMYYVSMDYGIQNPTAMLLFGRYDGVWYGLREYYHSGRETNEQKTDQQYYDELEKLCGDIQPRNLIIDPSASSFIALCRQKKRFKVWPANNAVVEGIANVAPMLKEKTLLFNDCCERTISEFGLYSWDGKAMEDRPIKENDHAMDALRYFVNTTGVYAPKREYRSIFGAAM